MGLHPNNECMNQMSRLPMTPLTNNPCCRVFQPSAACRQDACEWLTAIGGRHVKLIQSVSTASTFKHSLLVIFTGGAAMLVNSCGNGCQLLRGWARVCCHGCIRGSYWRISNHP